MFVSGEFNIYNLLLSLFLMNSVDCVTKLSLAGIQEGYATDRCM